MTKRGAELGFDPDALRARYRAERDKRLRDDGLAQYVEMKGRLEHFDHDPWVDPGFRREPLIDEIDVAIIGAGFSGLLTGARLRQLGVQGIRLIEKGGDFGGTWYWNRYPGLACDVESYVYLPMLEEIGTIPAEKYSRGAEILEHCRAIAREYDLYPGRLPPDRGHRDPLGRRRLALDSRDEPRRPHARALRVSRQRIPAEAEAPGVPGLEHFEGRYFHTSRWDYAYTEAMPAAGWWVCATSGSGSSEPAPRRSSASRTSGRAPASSSCSSERPPPSASGESPDRPRVVAEPRARVQEERIENFQTLTAGGHAEVDLVDDGWTEVVRKILNLMLGQAGAELSPEAVAEAAELADFMQMEEIRARVDALVTDPATAEALKPWYRQFCKRPCFHDSYLQTFNRPNVTLVDTQGKGVERITPRGIVANGIEYELDCLIFATGFEVGTDFSSRSGYAVLGREGRALSDAWADGVRTLHGIHIHGFPNCFMMSIAQSGFTVNFPYTFDLQARHIAWIVQRALATGWKQLEATAEAEASWVEKSSLAVDGRRSLPRAAPPATTTTRAAPTREAARAASSSAGPPSSRSASPRGASPAISRASNDEPTE